MSTPQHREASWREVVKRAKSEVCDVEPLREHVTARSSILTSRKSAVAKTPRSMKETFETARSERIVVTPLHENGVANGRSSVLTSKKLFPESIRRKRTLSASTPASQLKRSSFRSGVSKTKLFHGIYSAAVTPLDGDGNVNGDVIDVYAEHLSNDGVNGVFVGGTSGMSMSLSVPERKHILEAWIRAGKRHNIEVLAHIGAQSLADSKELAAHAESVGAAAVSAMAPCFFKPSAVSLLTDYLTEVAAEAPNTPFLYYHFPEITGVNFPFAAIMKDLYKRCPTLRGAKFTSTNMWDLGDCMDFGKSVGIEFDLLMGYEGQTISCLPLGVTAHIGIGFSVLGSTWNRMITAYEAGNQKAVAEEQATGRAWFQMFSDISGLWSMTAVTKLILQERTGVSFGGMRSPQKDLTAEETRLLHAAWANFQLTHKGLFEHKGRITKKSPTAAVPSFKNLPGALGKLDEKISSRAVALGKRFGVDSSDVQKLFPHLFGRKKGGRQNQTFKLGQYIDHTLLKATATNAEVVKLCKEAEKNNFYAVCVNSSRVEDCKAALAKGSDVKIAAVCGFPLGAMDTDSKANEAATAVRLGANEVDMVINVGKLLEGDYLYVLQDIEDVVIRSREVNPAAVIKVIFETCLLTEDQIIDCSIMSVMAGADFVKTSTGFSTGGATPKAVDLMVTTVGNVAEVKASGGVRDGPAATEYVKAGVTRIGTSSGVAIVSGSSGSSGY